MDKCEYYIHQDWKNKFRNKKAKELFNKFLDTIKNSSSKKKETNWEFFRRIWNESHKFSPSYARIPEDKPHPDYTKLP